MSTVIEGIASRDVLKRLRLMRVDELRGYERPDDVRVAEICTSLLATKILVNPIVVDEPRRLIVDGHHRREAFRWLGLSFVPTYSVDYRSSQVSVGGWSRYTDASDAEVRTAFDAITPGSSGDWRVIALSQDEASLAVRTFPSPFAAATFQHRVERLLTGRGVGVVYGADGLEWAPTPPAGFKPRARFFIDPVVAKDKVLEMAAAEHRFPHQINRHLIDRRPLRVRAPLDSVSAPERFERVVAELASAEIRELPAGARIDDRFYEERTLLFADVPPDP